MYTKNCIGKTGKSGIIEYRGQTIPHFLTEPRGKESRFTSLAFI